VDDAARARLEQEVRRLAEGGDQRAAATAALRGYGPEIFGFLMAVHRDESNAGDVFSMFSEDLWRSLAGFAWSCSLRTWAYTLARNASYRFRKRARRSGGNVPLSADGAGEIAAQVRTATLSYLRTEQKDRFTALRESLPAEEQMLLILRVDRGLAWEELARVMHDPEEGELDDEALKRESARLRKRFQLVKEKLVTMGKRAGLIKPKDG